MPPTLDEQYADVQRQIQLRQLAQLADERWASKPSFLDAPRYQAPRPATQRGDPGGYTGKTEPQGKEGVRSAVSGTKESEEQQPPEQLQESREHATSDKEIQADVKKLTEKKDPWKGKACNPGQEWQPQAWVPGAKR